MVMYVMFDIFIKIRKVKFFFILLIEHLIEINLFII